MFPLRSGNLLLLLIVLIAMVPSLLFATDCERFHLIDKIDSGADVNKLCEAAAPLLEEGYEVAVLIEDLSISKNDWYAYLDEWESNLVLRNGKKARSPSGIYNTVILIEVNRDRMVTITFGNMLKELVTESRIKIIKEDLYAKIQLESGPEGITNAIAWGMDQLYLAQSTKVVYMDESGNNGIRGPTEEEQANKSNDDNLFTNIYIFGFILGSIFLFFYVLNQFRLKRKKYKETLTQIERLKGYTLRVMNACDEALKGSSPERSDLYLLWQLYEGNYNSTKDSILLQLLDECKATLRAAYHLYEKLDASKPPANLKNAQKTLANWEQLFITILGQNTSLNLDKDKDTLLASFDVPDNIVEDTPLIRQVNSVYDKMGLPDLDNYQLNVTVAENADAQGLIGRIIEIKKIILEQQKAFEEFPRVKAIVERTMSNFNSSFKPPEAYNAELWKQFTQKSFENALALKQQRKVARAYDTMAALAEVTSDHQAIEHGFEQEKSDWDKTEVHRAKGYFLRDVVPFLDQKKEAEALLLNALQAGNAIEVLHQLKTKTKLAGEAQQAANNEVAQRDENEQLFQQFLVEFEKLDSLFPAAQKAQRIIDRYDNAEGETVKGYYDQSFEMFTNLITKSEKEHLNSMQVQEFTKLGHKIKESIGNIIDASMMLHDVIDHSEYLQQLEVEVKEHIQQAKYSIDRAKCYYYSWNYYQSYIDDAERSFNIANAYLGSLSITLAADAAKQAKEHADNAYEYGKQKEWAEEQAAQAAAYSSNDDDDSSYSSGDSSSWSSDDDYSYGGRSDDDYDYGGRDDDYSSGGRDDDYGSGGRV